MEKEQVSRSNILTSRTQKVSQQKEEKDNGINWKNRLDHCTVEVIAKTLENIPAHVESETHAYPIQHHQK
eukprot:984967-Ditylum_brightwellii.AAC.1